MKESTIENNINKSLNALKIGELGYAKEYANRILVEIPDHPLATQIRKYVILLKQKKDYVNLKRIDFFISTLKEPKANEMFPFIEFLCEEIQKNRIGCTSIEGLLKEIENSKLENDVLNDFYTWIKSRYIIEKEEEENWMYEYSERKVAANKKKTVKYLLITIVVVAVVVAFFMSLKP